MKDYYVLEYSADQGCFHHQNISDMVRDNVDTLRRGFKNGVPGYLCIGVFETEEERDVAQQRLEPLFENTRK